MISALFLIIVGSSRFCAARLDEEGRRNEDLKGTQLPDLQVLVESILDLRQRMNILIPLLHTFYIPYIFQLKKWYYTQS